MSTSSLVLNPAAAQAVATRVRWKIFFLMLMLTSINYIDRASLSVAMPLIGKEFALDPAMQGLILSSPSCRFRVACSQIATNRAS
jgi:MFS transporter, ACS family, D-galactonate transporter